MWYGGVALCGMVVLHCVVWWCCIVWYGGVALCGMVVLHCVVWCHFMVLCCIGVAKCDVG